MNVNHMTLTRQERGISRGLVTRSFSRLAMFDNFELLPHTDVHFNCKGLDPMNYL